VRVSGNLFEDKSLATTITVHGLGGGGGTATTSDKETTDDDEAEVLKDDRALERRLADHNAERLRQIRDTRVGGSPSATAPASGSPLSVGEDSDYDADCSATESPRKLARRSSASSSSSTRSKTSPSGGLKMSPTSHGVTIFEEEEEAEEEPDTLKYRVLRRIDTR